MSQEIKPFGNGSKGNVLPVACPSPSSTKTMLFYSTAHRFHAELLLSAEYCSSAELLLSTGCLQQVVGSSFLDEHKLFVELFLSTGCLQQQFIFSLLLDSCSAGLLRGFSLSAFCKASKGKKAIDYL